MDDSKQRKRLTIMMLGTGVSALLLVVGMLLWYVLPIYAPKFVVSYSHWPGPLARVFIHEHISYNNDLEIDNASFVRLQKEFKPRALALFADLLRSSGDEQVRMVLKAVTALVDEKTDTIGGLIIQALSQGRAPVDLKEAPNLVQNLSALLTHSNDRIVFEAIMVLDGLGITANEAVPALRHLADTTSKKHLRILALAAIVKVRTNQNTIDDISGAVDMFKAIVE